MYKFVDLEDSDSDSDNCTIYEDKITNNIHAMNNTTSTSQNLSDFNSNVNSSNNLTPINENVIALESNLKCSTSIRPINIIIDLTESDEEIEDTFENLKPSDQRCFCGQIPTLRIVNKFNSVNFGSVLRTINR